MAFVKVVGLSGDVKLVPRSSYESYLRHIGYKELDSFMHDEGEGSKDEGSVSDDDNGIHELSELESIPISEMSSKQLKEYARIKGIDLSGTESLKEAKDVVREWIREEGV